MIRKHKKYSRPRKPFDKPRIEEETVLREKYGLKNKREIWKADAAIGRIRSRAKLLITKSDEEKNKFIEKPDPYIIDFVCDLMHHQGEMF